MKATQLAVGLALFTMWACQPSKKEESSTETVDEYVVPKLTKLWETDTVLKTPESVIYDEYRDLLYVSNIGNVPPDSMDGDGFISIVSISGEVINKSWVNGVSGPKGMGILDSSLFVTDINRIVEIDIPSGQIINSFPVIDALFLNDITVSNDGEVLISDSFTNKIHVIKNGELALWSSDSTLGNPNGLAIKNNKLMMASFGSGQFFEIDMTSKQATAVSDSLGGGDGVVVVEDGYIVSDWNGRVFSVSNDYKKELILDTQADKKQTADIWYQGSNNTLYIATFFGNTVSAYRVE